MFYSDKVRYGNVYLSDYGIMLVTENNDILNEYGLSSNRDDEVEDIILTFTYVDRRGNAKYWDNDMLKNIHKIFITDSYKEFYSEDNESDIFYYLRGKKITKRFNAKMQGLIDVTFEPLSHNAFKKQSITRYSSEKPINILNHSNIDRVYKPLITLKNIQSESVSIANITTKNEKFTLNNIEVGVDIVIDNELGTITDSNNKNLIMNSNRKWVELISGSNIVKVDGECGVTIESMYPVRM